MVTTSGFWYQRGDNADGSLQFPVSLAMSLQHPLLWDGSRSVLIRPVLCHIFGFSSHHITSNLVLQLCQQFFETTNVYATQITSLIKWYINYHKTIVFIYR